MRKDMAKLILKGRSNAKDHSNKTKELDFENASERAPMRDPSYGWSDGPRDHINPLFNFLKANVGRPWDKVYAEICAVADARSFAGKHLRQEIERFVYSEEELMARMASRWWYGSYRDFYYDSNGILHRLRERRKCSYGEYRDSNNCVIAGVPYVRVNDCWFEGAYYTKPLEGLEWQYVSGERKNKLLPKQYVRSVKQLNKKQLKALGLSNEPGWKWYERSK